MTDNDVPPTRLAAGSAAALGSAAEAARPSRLRLVASVAALRVDRPVFITPPERPPRLDTLTGLRAVAALVVFYVHMRRLLSGRTLSTLSGLAVGGPAVTFFFALSGFVLTWTVRPGDGTVSFWRRRFARVYPTYFVGLLLAVLAGAVAGDDTPHPGQLAAAVVLVQSWIRSPDWHFAISPVAWSLSCETFFYLSFPLIIGFLLRLDRRGRRVTQVTLLGGILLAAVVTQVTGDSWWSANLPLFRVFEFVLGATVAVDVLRGESVSRFLGFQGALVLSGVALVVGALSPAVVLDTSVIPIVPFLLLLGTAAGRDQRGGRPTFLARPAMVWGGTVSYSFYLVHQPVIRMVDALVPEGIWRAGSGLPLAAGTLVLAVLTSWGVHVGIERPLERRLRGRTRHPGPVTVVAEATL